MNMSRPPLPSPSGRLALGSLTLGLLLPAANAQLTPFDRPIFFDPSNGVAIDYDGDGVEEVLRASPLGRTLEALVLDPSGDFVVERVLTEVTAAPRDVTLGDIDGDGALDLITLEPEPAGWRIRAYLNRGTAPFEPTPAIELAEPGDRVVTTDLDGDGNLDLLLYPAPRDLAVGAAPQPARTIRWVQNLGGGTFVSPTILSPLPNALSSARPIDVDLDGDVDFVGIEANTASLVLLRRSGLAYQPSPLPATAEGYLDLEVGDLDGDGFVDVVGLRPDAGQNVSFTADVFSATASGTFGPRTPLQGSSGNVLPDVALLDVNGDGALEIAASTAITNSGDNGHRALVWANDGQGGFPVRFAIGFAPGEQLTQVSVGDFNGDGRDDLFDLSLFRESNLVGATPAHLIRLGNGGSPLVPTFLPAIATNLRVPEISTVAADFDGDGVQDVLSSYGDEIVWARGQSDGEGFEAPRSLGALGALVFASNLDADSAAELLVRPIGSVGLTVIDNSGNGTLGASTQLPLSNTALQLSLTDLDSDGDLDLVTNAAATPLAWIQNLGGLTFAAETAVALGSPALLGLFDYGDFNGDGTVDVLNRVVGSFPFFEELSWFEGLGGGVFGPRQTAGTAGNSTVIADLNGDGIDDVVWISVGGRIGWTRGSPQGLGVNDGVLLVPASSAESLVGVSASTTDATLVVLSTNDQVLAFEGSIIFGIVLLSSDAIALTPSFGVSDPSVPDQRAQLVDFGSDGDLDLLVESARSPVFWLKDETNGLVGDSFCGPAVPNSTGLSATMLAAGSTFVAEGNLSVRATDLPANSFGFFIVGQTQVPATPVMNSAGLICLGGSIGRYVGPGEVQQSGLAGSFGLDVDLGAIPTPNGFVAATPGSTWSFQAWYRDTSPTGATSNFTDGLAIDVL